MSSLRTSGWSVQPSFVPHGPTTDVTLLCDERGITQLAGIPDVAWQTPWEELANLQLLRFARGMALFATVGGVRYCWRHRQLDDFEALREIVLAHGGEVTRRPRRAGALIVVGAVLLASFGGGIAALLTGGNNGDQELASARAVNLTLKDLPSGWSTYAQASYLGYLFPSSSQVITSTTTPTTTRSTTPSANAVWTEATHQFQRCLGVSDRADRIYGAAGQMPDYQVTSPVFISDSFRGIQMVSTTQYYATTAMVHQDTAEMSTAAFGGCFVAANESLLLAGASGAAPSEKPGVNWRPLTFTRGWSRAGVATLTLPGEVTPVHLVMVVTTSGHFETTLGALVTSWPESKSFIANAVNTLLSRMTSPTSSAV